MALAGLVQDLRHALRALRRNPGFTLLAALTLAIGIGANTAVFSVIDAVLLRPLPLPHPDELVSLEQKIDRIDGAFSWLEMMDYQRSGAFSGIAATQHTPVDLTSGARPERLPALGVTGSYFALLGAPAAQGRTLLPSDEVPGVALVVVLSDAFWRRSLNGDPDVLGRTLVLDNDPYTIVGVMPSWFRQPDGQATVPDLWLPMGFRGPPFPIASRVDREVQIIARLAPGVTLTQARARVAETARQMRAFFPGDYPRADAWSVTVTPVTDRVVGDSGRGLLVLFGAVGLVLLVACTNVTLLLLARAARREKEMALRHALGASRGRLVRQLLTESLLVAILGGGAGVLLSLWGTDLLVSAAPLALPRRHEVHVDGGVLAFTAGLIALVGLAFGLLPALRASRVDPNTLLAAGGRGMRAAPTARLRRALVILQVALATVTLAGAGLLLRSLWNVQSVDPGFEPDGVLAADLWLPLPNDPSTGRYWKNDNQIAFVDELLRRASLLPQVKSIGVVTKLPLTAGFITGGGASYTLVGGDGRPQHANLLRMSPGFLETLRVPIVAGRAFDARDGKDGAKVLMVSAGTARRRFGGVTQALGAQVRFPGVPKPGTVIGVFRDVQLGALDTAPSDELFLPFAQAPNVSMSIVVRGPRDAVGAKIIADMIHSIDRELPVSEVRPMTQVVAVALAQRRFLALLLLAFAVTALALAALGIYGTSSYAVAQRRHEIAVRMAVGATGGEVLRMVLGDALISAGAGAALGVAGAMAASRLLSGLLYGVTAADPLTFVALALVLAAVALAASALPARRAARVDPMTALRSE